MFALLKVISNLELPQARTDRGKDAADKCGRTNRPLDQGNVAHWRARTNHHLRGRGARSAAGQHDNRKVGPGWLGSAVIPRLLETFTSHGLSRDYARARPAVHAAGNVRG